jgi:hypothetical protein
MRTTVSRKIVLTKGPGDEVVLSAGEETGTGFLPLVCQPASVRRAGPDGERTPARSSKMLRLRSKSLGTEWSEGRAAHHTTTTGLRAASFAPRSKSKFLVKIAIRSGRSMTANWKSQPVLVPAIGSFGEHRARRATAQQRRWRVAPSHQNPTEPSRPPSPSRTCKTLAAKRSPRGFANVFDLLVHFAETH